VRIEYEPLPAVLTIEESERRTRLSWGEDNLMKSFLLEKGDVDSAWANAAHIVEGEYRTGAQEHLYIENNGMIAEWSGKRHHGVGLAAMPVLRAQVAARGVRSAR
jgi:xanthine dehydrogenase molybdopterin-binding subunit B